VSDAGAGAVMYTNETIGISISIGVVADADLSRDGEGESAGAYTTNQGTNSHPTPSRITDLSSRRGRPPLHQRSVDTLTTWGTLERLTHHLTSPACPVRRRA